MHVRTLELARRPPPDERTRLQLRELRTVKRFARLLFYNLQGGAEPKRWVGGGSGGAAACALRAVCERNVVGIYSVPLVAPSLVSRLAPPASRRFQFLGWPGR